MELIQGAHGRRTEGSCLVLLCPVTAVCWVIGQCRGSPGLPRRAAAWAEPGAAHLLFGIWLENVLMRTSPQSRSANEAAPEATQWSAPTQERAIPACVSPSLCLVPGTERLLCDIHRLKPTPAQQLRLLQGQRRLKYYYSSCKYEEKPLFR